MTKYAKIMISCFVAGILLVGIGCGIAFFEISSLAYGGVKNYESNAADITSTYEETFDENTTSINIGDYHQDSINYTVITDESVPTNKIIFEVVHPADSYVSYSYNNNYYEDDYDYYDDYHDDYYDHENYNHSYSNSTTQNQPNDIDVYFYIDNDAMAVPHLIKQVINDLKNDVYYNYIVTADVTIKINPANAEKINFYQ